MTATFFDALRRYRLGLVGWGLVLFVLTLAILQAYIAFAADVAESMAELMENMPQGLVKFANLTEIASPNGFLDARFFLIMPVLLGVYAALAGSGLLVQDEESGRLDLVLAHPVSRRSLFFGRLAALVVVLVGILTAGWLGMVAGSVWLSVDLDPAALALPFLCLFAVTLLTASMALLFSMLLPARRFAAVAAILVLAASFFLTGFARVDESLVPLARLLPLYYYQGAQAMQDFNATWFVGFLAASAVCVGLAYWRFERRDVRVAGESVVPWRKFAVAAAVAVVVVVVPVAVALRPKTNATPEAAFEAAVTALEQEDWETFARCLTPDATDDWNAHFVLYGSLFQMRERFMTQQSGASPGQEATVDQVMTFMQMAGKFRSAMKYVDAETLQKHDADVNRAVLTAMVTRGALPLDDGQRELSKLVKDRQKFLNKSLRAWAVGFHYPSRPRLENVEGQGDRARGTMVLPDGGRQEIRFEKIDGSWRVGLPFLAGEPRNP
jgi:ABC-2 type transport system permease protein